MLVDESQTTIAESARQCLVAFNKCFQRSSFVHPRDVSLVEDQFARFSLWTSSTGVFAPGSASMDHRLRGVPDVQDAIKGLLEALNDRVQTCTTIFGSTQHLRTESVGDSINDANAKLELTAKRIASDISLLYRLLNIIRKVSREAQDLKAKSFRIEDDENNDLEPSLRVLFAQNLRDQFPHMNETILQRLVSTMVFRRKGILYRRSRYGNSSTKAIQSQKQVFVGPESARMSGERAPTIIQSVAPTATTLAADKFKMASVPSFISDSKTVALSSHQDLVFPPAPKSHTRLKYERLEENQRPKHTTHVQDLLNKPEMPFSRTGATTNVEVESREILEENQQRRKTEMLEVFCPFCLQALSSEDVLDSKKWQAHVKNDLEPYVCLFEECDNPEELYSHSEDWLKHMRQHTLRWNCKSKSHSALIFKSGDQYEQHMREAHNRVFTDNQLQVLTKRCSRTTGPIFERCPLCGSNSDYVKGKLEDHIVGHMRFIALKSLPPYYDEGEEISNDENGSNSVDSLRTRSTIKLDQDRDLELTFDDNDRWRDNYDIDPQDRLSRPDDTRPDEEYSSEIAPGANVPSPVGEEDTTVQSRTGKTQIWRWICCRCGCDNSIIMDAACASCHDHQRDRTCTVYDANAR